MNELDFLKETAAADGIILDEKARERFEIFRSFLVEYNEHVNLTAITDDRGIIEKHFLDSMKILKYADIPQGATFCDVGCGAGFPSVPLLIARPDLKFTMIEATGKKLVFIEKLLEKLGLSANLVHARGEEAGKKAEYRECFDFVTARAVAALRELSEYCLPLCRVGGKFISMKGPLAETELADAKKAIAVLGGSDAKITEYALPCGDRRTVISIGKTAPTPKTYPRPSAVIAKKPIK